jgi:hypothetical protein
VRLCETTTEEYVPPRCKKPRTRIVHTPIGQWTLGVFRQMPTPAEQAELEELLDITGLLP